MQLFINKNSNVCKQVDDLCAMVGTGLGEGDFGGGGKG